MSMQAKVQIHENAVELNAEALAKLNEALMMCPVVTNKYNNKTDKYEDIKHDDRRVQLRPVFALKTDTIMLTAPVEAQK